MQKERYNINDLEKLTGIKAHTIRIWERRYSLLEPKRTETNIRYYTGEDLKRLLNISILNKNGFKISRIAEFREDEINEKVIEFTTRKSDVEDQVMALTMAMFNLDLQKFEKLMTVSYINRGFENTYIDIIIPFLTKIGFLWQTGTISTVHEHFATNIIKRKIVAAIDGILPAYGDKSKNCILFLPENEYHDISLLYSYYILKQKHHHVTYLGASVPFTCLDEINSFHKSDSLIVSFTSSYSTDKIANYLESLSAKFKEQKIVVFGPQMDIYDNALPSNVIKLSSVDEFVNICGN